MNVGAPRGSASPRGGFTLAETLVGFLLTAMVVQAGWTLFATYRKAGGRAWEVAEGLETVRTIAWLLGEEFGKLQRAGNRDVHDDSKQTTLPIAREIVDDVATGPRLDGDFCVHLAAQEEIDLPADAFHHDVTALVEMSTHVLVAADRCAGEPVVRAKPHLDVA